MPNRDAVRVRHMLEASRKVVEFAAGKTRDEFDTDAMLMFATLKLIEIIGEASKSVSEELRSRHPEINWRDIARTRDRLSHVYFDVDLDIVWEIVSTDLPRLVRSLESLLEHEGF